MRISRKQLEAFQRSAGDSFEEELTAHLCELAPHRCDALGGLAVRRIVRLGMERADTYGFTLRGPVRLYLESMFLFGTDFDTDPLLPWAGELLRSRAGTDEMTHASHLYSKAREYSEAVFGSQGIYTLRAVQAMRAALTTACFFSGRDFEADFYARLQAIHPEKCAYVGEQALLALVERAQQEAQLQSMDTSLGRTMLIVLMFMFGQGCVTDPQHPWINEILQNPSPGQQDMRAEQLRIRSIQVVEHLLAHRVEV